MRGERGRSANPRASAVEGITRVLKQQRTSEASPLSEELFGRGCETRVPCRRDPKEGGVRNTGFVQKENGMSGTR
eukprot:2424497-Prorocentrum_lima.AAC.1